MADYTTQVQQAYIGYYGRPADPAGLEYWKGKLDAAKGDWGVIVNAFGNSAEATAMLAGLTYSEQVNLMTPKPWATRLPPPACSPPA